MFNTFVRKKTSGVNEVEDLQDWVWPDCDIGSWGAANDGPLGDWLNSHKIKWFEHVRRYGVVLQAGGNMGLYARLLSDKFETVYTFEPHPLAFHCLVQNCQVPNIIKFNAALGPERSYIKNSIGLEGADNMGMNQIAKMEGSIIPMFTIDELNLPSCDLIALDVEGFEYNILCGSMTTIVQYKPVIILENGERPEIKEFLTPFGYRVAGKSVADTVWAPIL